MLIFRKRLWKDRFHTIRHYYNSPKFALIDLTFGMIALFANPYRICRKFLQKKGEANIYAYGETPFSTYQRIVEQCGIGPQDTWMELGSGRGKGCFWLNHFIGCKVIGIEWVPTFIFFARIIKMIFGVRGTRFEKRRIEEADLSEATVVYLYGVSREVPAGIKVISVSEPLQDCEVIKSFWVRYPWGRTQAFLQVKKGTGYKGSHRVRQDGQDKREK